MKNLIFIFLISVAISCNNSEPVKKQTESNKMSFGAALQPKDSTYFASNGDTITIVRVSQTKTGTVAYTYVADSFYTVRKKFIAAPVVVIPPVVTPPATTGTMDLSKLTKSGPITVKSNTNYENIWFTNPANAQNGNVVIGNGVTNVTFKNCRFSTGLGGDNGGGRGLYLYGSSGVSVTNCLFDNLRGGVLAAVCKGNIKINNNQFINMQGPFPNGQFVQFNQCTGTGNEIQFNQGEDFLNESNPEDMVNIFGGTSNTLINGNTFRAGGATSASGGGIVVGDGGGDNNIISNNKLVDPGQYGVSITGGNNNKIFGNQIYAKAKSGNNVGIPIWRTSSTAIAVTNVQAYGNRVHYERADGTRNDFWWPTTGGNAVTFTLKETPTDITLAEMNVPAQIITMVSADDLLKIRKRQL